MEKGRKRKAEDMVSLSSSSSSSSVSTKERKRLHGYWRCGHPGRPANKHAGFLCPDLCRAKYKQRVLKADGMIMMHCGAKMDPVVRAVLCALVIFPTELVKIMIEYYSYSDWIWTSEKHSSRSILEVMLALGNNPQQLRHPGCDFHLYPQCINRTTINWNEATIHRWDNELVPSSDLDGGSESED